MEVIEDVFDELYESKDADIINLVNTYGSSYRDDDKLKELILKNI